MSDEKRATSSKTSPRATQNATSNFLLLGHGTEYVVSKIDTFGATQRCVNGYCGRFRSEEGTICTGPVYIAIGITSDWNQTEYRLYRPVPIEPQDYTLILPLVLQYLTPLPIAVIGLGAVSAAVMSSADSSLMSSSSMFSHNIYKPFREAITKSQPGEVEIVWSMRVCIVCVGVIASLIAITVNSIYALFVLCGDLVYVMVFPQLCCVIHMSSVNTYGAVAGYVMSAFLRFSGGEPLVWMPALIQYPWYDEETFIQYFPFKTLSTAITIIIIIAVSYLMEWAFNRGILTPERDVFKCFVETVEKGKEYKGLERENSSNGMRLKHYSDTKGSMELIEGTITSL